MNFCRAEGCLEAASRSLLIIFFVYNPIPPLIFVGESLTTSREFFTKGCADEIANEGFLLASFNYAYFSYY
jgi:hypothetical protein